MISVLQRVREARVEVGTVVGAIGPGLLVLVCAEHGDSEAQAQRLLAKVLKLRIFSDAQGKMNRSVQDVGGGLLIVSQFTLAADASGGNRPASPGCALPRGSGCTNTSWPRRVRPTLRGNGRICRRHASSPGERRPGDDTAAHCAPRG